MAVGLAGRATPAERGAQQHGAVAVERLERHGGCEACEHCGRRAEVLGFRFGFGSRLRLKFEFGLGLGLGLGFTFGRGLQVRGVDRAEGQEEDTRAEQHADEVVV